MKKVARRNVREICKSKNGLGPTLYLPDYPKDSIMRKIYLAKVDYFATGEGRTVILETVLSKRHNELECDTFYHPFVKYIPLLSSKTIEWRGDKYNYPDINPMFKAEFLSYLGAESWSTFHDVTFKEERFVQLNYKMHFNLA